MERIIRFQKYVLGFFLLFFFGFGFSQIVNCTIVDKENINIPYANVSVKMGDSLLFTGVTNFKGEFSIDRSAFINAAELVVSHISYERLIMKLDQLPDSNASVNLYLNPKSIALSTVEVKPEKLRLITKQTGAKKLKEDVFHCGREGSAMAIYLALPKGITSGYVKNVKLLVSTANGGEFPFRVRFLKAEGNSSIIPKDSLEIQTEDIICVTPIGGGWVEIEVSDQAIEIDSNGVYCSIEWLQNDPLQVFEVQTFDKCSKPVPNMCLAKYHEKYSKYLTWYKTPTKQFGWYRYPKKPNTWITNPIIVAEIVGEKM